MGGSTSLVKFGPKIRLFTLFLQCSSRYPYKRPFVVLGQTAFLTGTIPSTRLSPPRTGCSHTGAPAASYCPTAVLRLFARYRYGDIIVSYLLGLN